MIFSTKYLLAVALLIPLGSLPLSAQLATIHPPELLLPVDFQPDGFAGQSKRTPPGDLKALMLQPEFNSEELATISASKVARREMSSASLMYRPHLAFFCRVEVKIDEAVGTPFRFRLGSVDYVDYLEGKRRSY